jgi:L-ascorbate metabolism protein UlaG (beta-lactamase superfamily)
MPTIRRLSDSCLILNTDRHATMIDPGTHTFDSGVIDLGTIGDVTRVLVTHEHGDHVKPEFIHWLIDRRRDLTVHSNQAVADLLGKHGINSSTANPEGVNAEDVKHEMTPSGAAPPNRAYTIEGVFTHPGDSYQLSTTAPTMALPLMAPWGSTRDSVEFARRLLPTRVIPVHDFYMSDSGRRWAAGFVKTILDKDGIELIPLDWGESATL